MREQTSRRQFIRQLTVFSGIVLFAPGSCASGQAGGDWVPVGPAKKIGPGEFTRKMVSRASGQETVYLSRDSQNKYLAFSARCTHKGCTVDWEGKRKQFVCPCHQGRYDAAGRNIAGPPPRPLASLPTKLDEKGILYVQIVS